MKINAMEALKTYYRKREKERREGEGRTEGKKDRKNQLEDQKEIINICFML